MGIIVAVYAQAEPGPYYLKRRRKMNIRMIQRMQGFEKDMEDPERESHSKALVRLYMLEALSELCQWDVPWASDSQEEARYWWNQVMEAQCKYEERIGA